MIVAPPVGNSLGSKLDPGMQAPLALVRMTERPPPRPESGAKLGQVRPSRTHSLQSRRSSCKKVRKRDTVSKKSE